MKTNKRIGERICEIRESKSISLADMIERSGLDEKQVVTIEETGGIPSLAPLIKIARVLGVRLGTFLDDVDETGPVISRKEQYNKSISFSTKDTSSVKHMDYYSLSSTKSGRHMEPFVIQIEPIKKGVDFILSTHEGEEFIYCLEGVVEINYGTDVYWLEEGDSIYYDSIVSHHVHAGGESGAKILAVIYTPL
ncbi:cupin domain-containing protein [Dysgonomonas sp. Marseille-Q5470]|uniref:helix-turn-helix domain-containing protein n=1 Tax=Dysgonomonas sp. Marseille-Q5470 TaxID=3039494 RepID=UPI0024BCA518|nr:cupin domain-containing protein [Dysgonomonas sp. Marseille-Q5470]MBS5979740.1 cupin domain-containing protein [Dysgonomonas mossii]